MDHKLYKLKYIGKYPIALMCDGFHGDVVPGQVVEVFKSSFDEMIGHDDWQAVTEKKTKEEVR